MSGSTLIPNPRSRCLLLTALATVAWNVGASEAQVASRVLTRAELPRDIQLQLPRGEVTRVSAAGVNKVAASHQVELRVGEVLAVRTGDSAVAMPRQPGPGPAFEETDSALGLPFTYLGLDRADAAPTEYRPVFLPAGPLRYRAGTDDFAGTFLLGLQDVAHPATIRELSAPVRMRFAGDPDSIAPDTVVLRETNAQMERIQVLARSAFDSVRVLIVPAFDPRGVSVWLPLQRALAFDKAPEAIQGLGVEGATLVVGRRGTTAQDSTPVTLSISQGSLETNRVFVSDGGGVVRIRSAGLGPATITARATGLAPAQVQIRYRWPIVFVIAALLGGLLGGLAAYMHLRRRTSAALGRNLSTGVVVGLLTCLVYFGLGINLLEFDVKVQYFNELAVFALAALAGTFGIPLLSKASK